ncbi:MAG: response regulator [Lachnospiraceae bacterium]|nr:response regulator [Lachnospiraceae bacterium]
MSNTEKTVVFLMNKYSIVVKGMEKRMASEGYATVAMTDKFERIKDYADAPCVFIMYKPEEILNTPNGSQNIVLIQDTIRDNDCDMIIVGDVLEEKDIKKKYPQLDKYRWMLRPIDIDKFSRDIKHVFIKQAERREKEAAKKATQAAIPPDEAEKKRQAEEAARQREEQLAREREEELARQRKEAEAAKQREAELVRQRDAALAGQRQAEEALQKQAEEALAEVSPLSGKELDALLYAGGQAGAPAKKKHILIVDDDPSYAGMIRIWLKDIYRVDVVTAGIQAITFLTKFKVDLILLDYEMPVVNGPQVLEMLRQEETMANIPVIFLTGVSSQAEVKRVMELKPAGYLLKSSKKEDIIAFIDSKLQ